MNIQELKDKYPEAYEKAYQAWSYDGGDACFDGWWDSVYEGAIEDGKAKGFIIDDIQFTGFYSQGDGASWTGSMDIKGYLAATGQLTEPEYSVLCALVDDGWCEAVMHVGRTSSRYSHENTMTIDDAYRYARYGADTVQNGVYAGMRIVDAVEFVEQASIRLESEMLEAARDYARDIYRSLRDEYEYLTSEERFVEVADEYKWEFDEEGGLV